MHIEQDELMGKGSFLDISVQTQMITDVLFLHPFYKSMDQYITPL